MQNAYFAILFKVLFYFIIKFIWLIIFIKVNFGPFLNLIIKIIIILYCAFNKELYFFFLENLIKIEYSVNPQYNKLLTFTNF